jgi:hypothetical protein
MRTNQLSRQRAARILGIIFGGLLALPAASPLCAAELDGRWPHGSWIDTNKGHEGPLRAHFRATDDCHCRVVFTGRFFKVIPFRFATTLNVVGREGAQVFMQGESPVGLFGRFTYSAVADGCHFHADYCSSRWRGEFNLNR